MSRFTLEDDKIIREYRGNIFQLASFEVTRLQSKLDTMNSASHKQWRPE